MMKNCFAPQNSFRALNRSTSMAYHISHSIGDHTSVSVDNIHHSVVSCKYLNMNMENEDSFTHRAYCRLDSLVPKDSHHYMNHVSK